MTDIHITIFCYVERMSRYLIFAMQLMCIQNDVLSLFFSVNYDWSFFSMFYHSWDFIHHAQQKPRYLANYFQRSHYKNRLPWREKFPHEILLSLHPLSWKPFRIRKIYHFISIPTAGASLRTDTPLLSSKRIVIQSHKSYSDNNERRWAILPCLPPPPLGATRMGLPRNWSTPLVYY